MPASKPTQRTCKNGHQYYKSSDCPVCPICEKQHVADADFLHQLAAPARRALEGLGIKTLKQLARHTEEEILSLHGMGPGSIPKLIKALEGNGLSFKQPKK